MAQRIRDKALNRTMRGVLFTASTSAPIGRGRAHRTRRGRTVGFGAGIGLIIALGVVLAMPTTYVATADLHMRPGSSFHIPSFAAYSPRAQLYGALGPGDRRATVSLTAAGSSPRRARRLLRSDVTRYATQAPVESATITTRESPRSIRDLLLGLIAGALLALAYTVTIQRWRGSSSW